MFRANILVLRKLAEGCPRDVSIPFLFLLHVNNMKQTVDYDLFLYTDDSCLVYQQENVKEIEKNLNKDFSNVCNWRRQNKVYTIWHRA